MSNVCTNWDMSSIRYRRDWRVRRYVTRSDSDWNVFGYAPIRGSVTSSRKYIGRVPTMRWFSYQKMVNKRAKRRVINNDTARRLLMWSHYKFRQRLLHKARQWGRTVVIVNEAYTSKTCTRCGWQNDQLGCAKVFICRECHLRIDRDVNGARNILLRNTCT